MDIGTVSPSSPTTPPVAGVNRYTRATKAGSPPAPASSAESMHVDMRATQVTLSSNSALQFAVPSSLVPSTPLYTASGLAGQLQSLQTHYANDLLAPTAPGSGNSLDINKGEQVLGSFAEQELASQIGSNALQNSTITFDNFSAQSSDATSLTQTQIQATQNEVSGTSTNAAAFSQSTTEFNETTSAKLAGSGHITLANGQTIAFKAELDVSAAVTEADTSADLAVGATSQSAADANNAPAATNSSTTSSVNAPAATDNISTGQSLSTLLKSPSPPPTPLAASDPANAHSKKSHKANDWNAMLSQYSNLIDIINSVKAAVDSLRPAQPATAASSSAAQPVQASNGTANSLIPTTASA